MDGAKRKIESWMVHFKSTENTSTRNKIEMLIHYSGEGETSAHPEDLLKRPNIMMTFWLTYTRKRKGIQPRFLRLVKARKKGKKK